MVLVPNLKNGAPNPDRVEKAEGEEYVHKTVWRVAQRQLANAEANPTGGMMDYLVALVFVSHAMEGYANYLGDKVAPEIWKDERTRFPGGLTDKFEALHEICALPAIERGNRPWQTIRGLKELRDSIAHPRIRVACKKTEFVADKEPPLFAKSWLDSVVSKTMAVRAIEDAHAIADRLHNAAMTRFPRAGLLPGALDGISSIRRTSVSLL